MWRRRQWGWPCHQHARAAAYAVTDPASRTGTCTDPHADAYSGAVFLRYRRISDV
ncbi:hypothetical protein GCM10022600_24350 [Qipengyuania pelagi]